MNGTGGRKQKYTKYYKGITLNAWSGSCGLNGMGVSMIKCNK